MAGPKECDKETAPRGAGFSRSGLWRRGNRSRVHGHYREEGSAGPARNDMNPADSRHADALNLMMPLGRVGQPEEIASIANYLAGDEARFLAGASFTLDGGYTA